MNPKRAPASTFARPARSSKANLVADAGYERGIAARIAAGAAGIVGPRAIVRPATKSAHKLRATPADTKKPELGRAPRNVVGMHGEIGAIVPSGRAKPAKSTRRRGAVAPAEPRREREHARTGATSARGRNGARARTKALARRETSKSKRKHAETAATELESAAAAPPANGKHGEAGENARSRERAIPRDPTKSKESRVETATAEYAAGLAAARPRVAGAHGRPGERVKTAPDAHGAATRTSSRSTIAAQAWASPTFIDNVATTAHGKPRPAGVVNTKTALPESRSRSNKIHIPPRADRQT